MPATTDIDMSAYYSVAGYGAIAWYLIGYDTEWTPEEWEYIGGPDDDPDDECNYLYSEPEEIENRERVRAIMVGDDRVFTFELDELTVIGDDDYCHECGQIGCTGDFRDRSES